MKYLHYLTFLTFTLTAILFLLVGYWLFWTIKTMEIKNGNAVPVDQAIYHPGDRLSYTITYCKYRNIQGLVSRVLVNGVRVTYTELINNIAPGCGKTTVNDLIIPIYTEPDTYHIETTVTYKLNPLRDVVVSWRSVDFKVIK